MVKKGRQLHASIWSQLHPKNHEKSLLLYSYNPSLHSIKTTKNHPSKRRNRGGNLHYLCLKNGIIIRQGYETRNTPCLWTIDNVFAQHQLEGHLMPQKSQTPRYSHKDLETFMNERARIFREWETHVPHSLHFQCSTFWEERDADQVIPGEIAAS